MRPYRSTGFLAVNPRAFFDLFPESTSRLAKVVGNASVIEVVGPVVHHEGGWCDSYDSIATRIDQAIESGSSTIILKIDSPGGEASGCMDAAREIRARCEKAGCELVAFIDGQACSAAYALACAANFIAVPAAGIAGSIGVLHMRLDTTQQDAMMGMSFSLISSSNVKGDNNPHVAVTEAELARTQATVDKMASEFFQLVADSRGLTVDHVAGLNAGLFVGSEAVGVGLADTVASFDELLALVAAGKTKGLIMSKSYEDTVAALRKMAEGDSPEAKKAKRMLRAELEEEKEPEASSAPAPAASDEEKEPEASSAPAPAAAVAAPAAASASSGLTFDAARIEALETDARSNFLATRPDLSKDFVSLMHTKPLAEVKAMVNAIPRAPKPVHNAAPVATRAAGQDGTGTESRLPEAEKHALDVRMGLRRMASVGIVNTPHTLTLGSLVAVPSAAPGKVG